MCHSREPYYDGIRRAPKNVLLETPADVAKHARQIYLQAGATHAMPPANVTYMEDEERALIRKWYADGAKDLPFYMAGN
ncbi:cysteine desulfurase, partial [Yangia sp. PrR004]|nr:cysteine desulfurase [Salipiger sp. PrR004]